MDPFQERLDKAVQIGRDIKRLEDSQRQVENEIRIMTESLSRIKAMITQLWIEEGKLRRS